MWKCEWNTHLNHPYVLELFKGIAAEHTTEGSVYDTQKLLAIGIASLQAFVQQNFVGPDLESSLYDELEFVDIVSKLDCRGLLIVDGEEINVNVTKPELLVLTKTAFEHLLKQQFGGFHLKLWYIRYLYVHQAILDDATNTLYTMLTKYHQEILQESLPDNETLGVATLEILQGYLAFRRVTKSEAALAESKRLLNADLKVEGVLGKRTKYQQKALPQLALTLDVTSDYTPASLTHAASTLPKLLKHEDDVRLEKITFISEEHNTVLEQAAVVQLLILSTV